MVLATFLLLLMKKNFIESEIAAFEVLEQEGQMGVFNIINGLQYLSIPLVYLWKFTVIAFLIWIGCFMFGYKVTFTKTWQVVMIAEAVFFVPELIKIFHFIFIYSDPDLYEVRAYYPLSLMNFFDHETLDGRWHYPLKSINLFEIIYWFVLAYGIHLAAKKKAVIARAIVFSSYVFFFLLWLGFYAIVYK